MNKVILMGRLAREPEVRYSQGTEPLAIARYTLAVNRRFKRQGEPEADFINCVAFGKTGEFAEKYFKKGQMVSVVGRLQVRSWEDNEGKKRWSTDVIVEEQYFAEGKHDSEKNGGSKPAPEQNRPAAAQSKPAASAPAETKPAEPAKPTASQASGYVGSSASALESALGAPTSKSYSPSCMGEGEDGIWTYDGFTVYTYKEGGSETVEAVQ